MSVTVTAPAAATFSVSATAPSSGTLSYQWYKNGTAVAGATSSTYTTPATSSADNGATFYVLVYNNGVAYVKSNVVTLTVH